MIAARIFFALLAAAFIGRALTSAGAGDLVASMIGAALCVLIAAGRE